MPATIRDVKNKTGLSLATISKYLNGGNVLPENRVLIEAAIKELNYEVNEIARGLVKNKTKTVGVLVYDISSFFSSNILHHIGVELRKQGYGMMICDSCDDVRVEEENLKFLLSRKVDGIIVMPVSISGNFLQPAKKVGIPVVLLDRSLKDEAVDCVCIENRLAAFKAVNVLIENNHEKIAIIGTTSTDVGTERLKGYKEALEQAGIPVRPEYMKLGKFAVPDGYEKMKQLLEMKERPTAVFMANYETALGGVMAINESGFSCPEDVSLFCFDDLLVSSIVKPSLWTVEQPVEMLCQRAVSMLLDRINNENMDDPIKMSFGVKIHEGDSIRKIERNVSL